MCQKLGMCAQLLTRTLPTGLLKVGLENPCAPGDKGGELIREGSKKIWGKEDHHGNILQVSNDS